MVKQITCIVLALAFYTMSFNPAPAQSIQPTSMRIADNKAFGEMKAGRFQLFAADTVDHGGGVNKSGIEKSVFLLDTQIGDLWEYGSSFEYTDGQGNQNCKRLAFTKFKRSNFL